MSSQPKPCAYCGHTQLVVVPNVCADLQYFGKTLGMNMGHELKGHFWIYTLVICNQCGYTQMFTTNAPELAKHIPGTQLMNAPPQ